MDIYTGSQDVPLQHQGGVVALGNFDGVHRGHQILLQTARSIAQKNQVPFGVMSFEPHPRAFFSQQPIFQLSPPNIKPLLCEVMAADFLRIYDFDKNFSSLSAREFVEKTIVNHLKVHTIVCGYDFHFGKGREGNPETLKALGRELGFDVEIVSVQKSDKEARVFSSSHIREDLRKGDVVTAAHHLGRWWSMRGTVKRGEGQGKFLGFPTANIALDPTCALKPGVYAARLRQFGATKTPVIDGAAYIGKKPTFGDFEARLEVFLFDFDADLYGDDVLVEFISFIRDDIKFDSGNKLSEQMEKDCASAAEILNNLHKDRDPMRAYEMGRFFAP